MMLFRNLSIKNKIVGMILLVSATIVVFGFTFEQIKAKSFLETALLQDAVLEAKLIGNNSVVPLSVDDKQQGERVLERLRSIPSIDRGYVYDANGNLFAKFQRSGMAPAPQLPNVREQAFFADGHLHTYQPILYENKDLGTVYLRTSTLAIDRKLREGMYVTAALALVLIAASVILALWFQGLISRPILDLAKTASEISASGDYATRVLRYGDDEIGLLYNGFNNMLSQIEARDQSLRLAHERLRDAQRIGSVGNWDWNIATNELWWSDEIFHMFQMDPDEFTATYNAFMERVHPEDQEMLNDAVLRALAGTEDYSIDHRIVRPDGTQRDIHEQGEVTFDDDGQAIRMIGTVHDITERKRAERDIRKLVDSQALLVDISSQLLRAKTTHAGENLHQSLERIGERYSLDSISMWWFDEERKGMNAIHRWERIAGSTPPEYRDSAGFPWFAERLLKGGLIAIDDVAQMPAEAMAEQAALQEWGMSSVLVIPLVVDERLEGTCLFSTVEGTQPWSEVLVAELQLVSENLAGAYARSIAMIEVEQLRDQLQDENIYLREEVKTARGFDEIIGESPELMRILQAVDKVAPTDGTVLIQGETGTGKELIARAIHESSARRDKPLVCINCPTLPANMIESELFGHEKGAFTGAHAMRKGRFEVADGGTLFLDEMGELAPELQSKLLRVLQAGEFQRVGGNKTLHADVRLIAATNRDLQEAVDRGQFRADLYYRINTFPIHLPALRDRKNDIPLLAEHFVHKHAARLGKNIDAISAEMITAFKEHSWPGNIRELEGVIERALISSGDRTVLELSAPLRTAEATKTTKTTKTTASRPEVATAMPIRKSSSLSDAERSHIVDVLEKTGWRIEGPEGASAMLGLAASTLRSMMKRLGITRPTT